MSPRRFLPALFLLFVGSGCAALIYEIVWFQLLQLVIGSSAISLGILLGTFMGGMCLGSLLLPRLIPARVHPLRVYAALELGIGVLAILILVGMPLVGGIYTAWAGEGVTGIVFRAVIAGICLLPPTILMGATLPAISRWVKATPDGVAWLGFFYGGNIAGGVIGSLVAGFYLLRMFDVATATAAGVALNLLVALIAYVLAGRTEYVPDPPPARGVSAPAGTRTVYVAIALSGMTALSAEVVWTRLLSLHFGATVYTFSLILAVFLLGLGIGSTVGAGMARGTASPRRALGWCQLLLCGAVAWAAYQLTQSLPYWPINPYISTTPWFTLQLDLVRCMWVTLPGAMLWGASFPLALAAVASTEQDAARLAGGVYAANTVGAIVGSMVTSFVLIPWIGSSHTEQVIIIVSALSALLMLEPSFGTAAARPAGFQPSEQPKRSWNVGGTIVLAAAMVCAGLLARSVHELPGILVAYGRYAATRVGQANIIYVGEGLNAAVAVSELSNGVRNYHNAGKVQASSEPQDMRLQRMLGHLTTLLPEHPKKVLVIGCGAGVTAGAVSIDPAVEHETIAEIEPLVPKVVSTYFADHNFDVVRNPKVRVRIDDARHFVETTNETFDAITSDPLDPWVKGAAMLYTRRVLRDGEAASEPRRRRHAVRAALREQHRGGEERDRHVPGSVSQRHRLRQHERGQGVRPRAGRPESADPDRRRPGPGEAAAAGVRGRGQVASGDRHDLGGRSVRDLRRPQAGSGAVAARRDAQSRPQPAAAVPRGPRAEPLSGRRDLRRHAAARLEDARGSVHRVGGDQAGAVRGDPDGTGTLTSRIG